METRRLKTCIDDEGLTPPSGSRGLLPMLMERAGWSLRVDRLAGRTVAGRRLVDLDIEVPPDEHLELPVCRELRIVVGAEGHRRLNLRLLGRSLDRRDDPDDATVAVIGGDLSIVLPHVGLIPVGRLAGGEVPVAGRPVRLSPDLAALVGSVRSFGAPLGSSLLVADGRRGGLRVTPPLDLRGRVYRIGDTGVLVGFEGLAVTCDGTRPRIDFRGGRLWRQP